MLRAMLLAAHRTPCVPRSVAPDTCRVVVRRVLLSVASRHGIYFHLVCEDALEAARRMCSPANAMLRVSVTTVRMLRRTARPGSNKDRLSSCAASAKRGNMPRRAQ